MTVIRFLSNNQYKIAEAELILGQVGIQVVAIREKINELQALDTEMLVRDKALKAFKKIGRPLFVEHTGLYLELLNDFPGGLTQIFWDKLGKEKFSQLCSSEQHHAIAKTLVCLIDGKKSHIFEGSIKGRIVAPPRHDNGFQWDCVFVPEGYVETFSEMGKLKNEISMRRLALTKLAEHLAK